MIVPGCANVNLGQYLSAADAANAWDRAAVLVHGQAAQLNYDIED